MSRIVLGMIREDYKNLARSMALSKELTNHSLPEIGMEATPERATPDCPEVVMPSSLPVVVLQDGTVGTVMVVNCFQIQDYSAAKRLAK